MRKFVKHKDNILDKRRPFNARKVGARIRMWLGNDPVQVAKQMVGTDRSEWREGPSAALYTQTKVR